MFGRFLVSCRLSVISEFSETLEVLLALGLRGFVEEAQRPLKPFFQLFRYVPKLPVRVGEHSRAEIRVKFVRCGIERDCKVIVGIRDNNIACKNIASTLRCISNPPKLLNIVSKLVSQTLL